MNPQSQRLLIPSGFDGLLQIGQVVYGTRSKDSTCADFEWHAGRASTELKPVASSERNLFSTLAPTFGSRRVHLLEPRKDCQQDSSNQQCLPITSECLLAH